MKESQIFHKLNLLYYTFKRNNWLFDPRQYFSNFMNVSIDKPIFLLGTQGGGLTLISRMLRRNKLMVSVTGNYRYWAGADEMQLVLEAILPPKLTGIGRLKVPPDELFGKPRGWVYATDRLLDHYRNQAGDIDAKTKDQFKKILRWIIARNAIHPNSRFIDKSQLFTIKVSFLNCLLEGCDPRFVLIVRDPYVSCYRAAKKNLMISDLKRRLSFEQFLEFASQHWSNSMRSALEDGKSMSNFKAIRFEDILQNPKSELMEICEFIELDFSAEMLPRPGDQIPFGSLRRNRWYPLRVDVNQRYFEQIEPEHAALIAERCGELGDYFGYDFPFR